MVAGVGISMALPTVPTAVVFAIAIGSAVFSAHGHLGSPAAVTAGFRPALWSCVVFAALAAVTAAFITQRGSDAAVIGAESADTPAGLGPYPSSAGSRVS